jgi:hypothetical protein
MIYSIDQNRWSLASAELDFAGYKVIGVSSLGLKEELTPSEEYGNGPAPVGRTIGQYKASGDCEIILVEYQNLIQTLGAGFMTVPFGIGATYFEAGGDGIMSVQVTGARITNHELSNSNDGKATRMKFSLSIITPILWNGVSCLDLQRGLGSIGSQFGVGFSISF